MQHLGAHAGHFQHFFIGHTIHLAGAGADVGVGGVDAVHIRVDLAFHRTQGGSQGNGRSIGAAAAQSGDALGLRAPLETGDHQHVVLIQIAAQALAVDGFDTRIAVIVIGNDGDLPCQQGAGTDARVFEQHGEERDGDLFPGGDQRITFRRIRGGGPLGGQGQQTVGLARTGGKHDHHLVALVQPGLHFFAHFLHALQVCH